MIRIYNCNNKNYVKKILKFLNRRRYKKEADTKIVPQIIKDIKKNKKKALLKYEKRFSRNNSIKPSLIKIKDSIKSLDPKIKKAIDFSYKRIFKFHSLQKFKNILYKDKLNNKLEYNA